MIGLDDRAARGAVVSRMDLIEAPDGHGRRRSVMLGVNLAIDQILW